MHDNTNRKSYENLWRWLNEVLMAHKGWTSSTSKSFPYKELESLSSSQQTQSPLPLLVIGTKTDVGGARLRKCTIVEEYGGDFLDMVSLFPVIFYAYFTQPSLTRSSNCYTLVYATSATIRQRISSSIRSIL